MKNIIVQAYYQHRNSFFTFLIAGIGTTTTYIGLFSLFWYVFHLNHILSVSIAFAIAATFQFFANRQITFKRKGDELVQEILRYLILLLINYLLSVVIMQLCIELFQSPVLGLILTVLINPVTGYLLFRFWIFRQSLST